MRLSIVVPVFNEEESLLPLYNKLREVLEEDYEIIFVDDGSTDRSFETLKDIANDRAVKVIRLKRNFGQTAALSAGFERAKGDVIIPIDADLQNDPADIPKLIEKIKEGFDVVSGWRRKRKDHFFTRRLPSMLANKLISLVTGVYLNDYGCTLKAYKSNVFKNIRLYGEMHRFLPALAAISGAKIAEIEVSHHPRKYGKSKYGMLRIFKVLLDLLTVKFMGTYFTKPIYIFGGIGVFLNLSGIALFIFVVIRRYFFAGEWVSPMILLSLLCVILGFQFISLGLLAEIMIRTYYADEHNLPYVVEDIIDGN